jgi:uncharacterized protein
MEPVQKYLELRKQLDAEITRLSRLHGPLLNCREGCSTCCTELTLLPLELDVIRRCCTRLDKIQQKILNQQAGAGPDCPFLHRQRCLIYPDRPIICRTHGLPLAYVDPDREVVEVSACPINFPAEYEFATEELLFLDPYNERLLQINVELAHWKKLPDGSVRVSMRRFLREMW